jgi:hypothetical protein
LALRVRIRQSPRPALDPRQRRTLAISCDQSKKGAGAISRRGDPHFGDFDDAVVLFDFGDCLAIGGWVSDRD